MNEFSTRIEALEHRWMRAWMARNRQDMKAVSARDMIVLFAAAKPSILDRASWLDAIESRLRCSAYRFGNVYVRRLGKHAVFAAPVELESTLEGQPLATGSFVTSVWERTAVRRRWHKIECVLANASDNAELPGAIRSLQLWR